MSSYYTNTIVEIKKKLKEKGSLTKEEWNNYKTGKPLWGAESTMWVYAKTEDWNKFINKIKQEI